MLSKNILISGAGQLGSRYLQGLSKCQNPLNIYVHDLSSDSLKLAEVRWEEANEKETKHSVRYLTDLNEIPKSIQLAIVSSTSTQRPKQIAEIKANAIVENWILEKVLAQSLSGLNQIETTLGRGANAWVNTPLRNIPWYRSIRNSLKTVPPLDIVLESGPWGLACNSIHFIDLVVWFTNEKLIKLNTSALVAQWQPAKRNGYWEVFGTLIAEYSGGSKLVLTSFEEGEKTILINISDNIDEWTINEETGIARSKKGNEILGRLPFQSEMTGALVDEILNTGNCNLCPLIDSIRMHEILLTALLEHWQINMDPDAKVLPIT